MAEVTADAMTDVTADLAVEGLRRPGRWLSAGGTRASAAPLLRADAESRTAAGSVRFEAVSKTFRSAAGAFWALDRVDLEIPAGAIFGIIGRSGAGKSTLLRTVNRLETPTGGRVLVDGAPIQALDQAGLVALRRRVGMIFQHFNLLSAKTVRRNVALPLVAAGAAKAEIDRRVDEVLRLVGLDDKAEVYPARLSGGQKQRVGIARALVSDPQILLCDEATSALDPETTLSILGLLRDINRRLGITIVLITHEMSVIRDVCTDVVVLEEGRIAEQGPVWRVFGAPEHPATRALLEPLNRGLPADLAARLRPQPAAGAALVLELAYSGGTPPDLSALAAAAGAPLRLLQAGIERIQGRAVGRMLVALDAQAARRDVEGRLRPLGAEIRRIGYVASDD